VVRGEWRYSLPVSSTKHTENFSGRIRERVSELSAVVVPSRKGTGEKWKAVNPFQ
jgi:hypothetical protein